MSKPPPPPRAKSATDVRRTLFRSLSRTAGAATTTTNLASTSNIPGPDSADEDAEAAAPEGIIVRRKDGSMDIEIPLTTSQHAQLLDGIGRELAEQQRLAAELVKRHQVDAYKRLPGQSLRYGGSELLRLQVLSLAQDSWMFESDEEC